MADHADDGGNNDGVFVYMGGDQQVPKLVRYVRIHKSVKIITQGAFFKCRNLESIEMHDGVEIIENSAFYYCLSLREIKLPGVRVIEEAAFWHSEALADVEFGDKLETIGNDAFSGTKLRSIKLPKVRVIGEGAFLGCEQLTDVELSEDLERIEGRAFAYCTRLRRIAIPLQYTLLDEGVFDKCGDLSQVELIGGIHKTVSSLLLESWRNEMKDEIDSINRVLPRYDKTVTIRQWMGSVLQRIEHYTAEHYALLKEFTTRLEIALWKVKLDESQDDIMSLGSDQSAKKPKLDMKAVRQEQRITSGASIVIKNVLPFLKLE
jgi:hypothetical protein